MARRVPTATKVSCLKHRIRHQTRHPAKSQYIDTGVTSPVSLPQPLSAERELSRQQVQFYSLSLDLARETLK